MVLYNNDDDQADDDGDGDDGMRKMTVCTTATMMVMKTLATTGGGGLPRWGGALAPFNQASHTSHSVVFPLGHVTCFNPNFCDGRLCTLPSSACLLSTNSVTVIVLSSGDVTANRTEISGAGDR